MQNNVGGGGLTSGAVRLHNRRLLLQLLRANGPMSRVSLAAHSGLSASAVTNVVAQLLVQGVVPGSGGGTPRRRRHEDRPPSQRGHARSGSPRRPRDRGERPAPRPETFAAGDPDAVWIRDGLARHISSALVNLLNPQLIVLGVIGAATVALDRFFYGASLLPATVAG